MTTGAGRRRLGGRIPMADAEIDAVREILASTPRPAGLAECRERLDALGSRYPLPADPASRAGGRERGRRGVDPDPEGRGFARNSVFARRRLCFRIAR